MTDERNSRNLWQVIMSMAAALFGVQSERNRELDFTHGKPMHYIIVGLVMTALLVLLIYVIVQLVLRQAGA
jgi:hypothetical protein